eukprot:UN06554
MSMATGAYVSKNDGLVLGCIHQNFDGASIEWYHTQDGDSHKQTIPAYDHTKHGDVLHIFPHVTSRGQERAIVLSEDFSLTFVKNGKSDTVWSRPEALAKLQNVEIVDFPLKMKDCEGEACDVENTFSSLPSRLHYDLQYVIATLKAWSEGNFDSSTDPEIFGFRKLIVGLVSSGNIFGIDSLTGKMEMKKFLPTHCDDCKLTAMHKISELPNPLFAIVGESTKDDSCFVLHFDIVNEQVIKTAKFPECRGVFRFPFTAVDEYEGISVDALGVLTGNKFETIPQSVEMEFTKNANKMFFHTVNYEENCVIGYGVKPNSKDAWNTWRVNFGSEQKIIKVAKRDEYQKVADTLYRPGGNRAVKKKYLNPHLIVVMTKVVQTTDNDWVGVNVYLIDTVDGEIIE